MKIILGIFMGYIYRNLHEISVPDFATPDRKTNEVSVYYRDASGKRRRYIIGQLLSNGNMHPNDNFRRMHSDLWEAHYGPDKKQDQSLSLGLYASALAVSESSGLYQAVQAAFGPEKGNAFMDYALFNISENTNALTHFPYYARKNATFSIKPKDDAWYSREFNSTDSDEITTLREQWLYACRDRFSIKKVWLAVDGTNDDCKATKSELAAQGKSKSGTSSNIVGQIWAVAAGINMPVTWLVNRGNMTDATAFEKIIKLLAQAGIEVEGVILDRGFNGDEIISLVESLGYNWIMMLKGETYAHQSMMKDHSAEIYFKVSTRVKEGGLFGVSSKQKLFRGSDKESYVSLFFHGVNGAERFIHHMDKAMLEYERAKGLIANGKTSVSINPKFSQVVQIVSNDSGGYEVYLDREQLQRDCGSKGYFSIASSVPLDAAEAYSMYSTRDCVEKTFSVKKSQIGHDTLRSHFDEGINARIACSFIACVIRSLIGYAADTPASNINSIINGLKEVQVHIGEEGKLPTITRATFKSARKILDDLGITTVCLQAMANEIADLRVNSAISQVRKLPHIDSLFGKKKRGRKKAPVDPAAQASTVETEGTVKRRPGRPAGSKNKKTIEREAAEANKPPKPPAKRGRPLGSKNKKTLEREAELAKEQVKRRPGRPPGSKNKKTLEREAELAKESVKRGRGRPAGSRNKSTIEREQALAAAMKRRPGRPPGSRNRTPEERAALEAAKRPRGRPSVLANAVGNDTVDVERLRST